MTGYVTVAEADDYVSTHYSSTNLARARWGAMSEADKIVYLLQSVEALEQLPFHGRKSVLNQQYAFPRYPQTVVPTMVKYAQIENALTLSDESSQADTQLHEKLRLQGVSRYSIGNLSESLEGSGGRIGVVSAKALQLLTPYLSGGYRI